MLSVEDALKVIADETPSPRLVREPVSLNLVGAVLAEDVVASESVPAFRASIVDGYAVSITSLNSISGNSLVLIASIVHG